MKEELTPIEPIEEYPIEEEVQEIPCTIIKDGKASKLTFTPDEKYNIGESFEDYLDGKMVVLSDEQVAFYEENPNAGISEVWDMKLAEPYEPTLEDLKREKIAEIERADDEAEHFIVNGYPMWLDKELRNSLLNVTLPALKSKGLTKTLLWNNGTPPMSFEVDIDFLIGVIPDLELYAKLIYDNTHKLLARAYNAESKEELDFEIAGYPKTLTFNL